MKRFSNTAQPSPKMGKNVASQMVVGEPGSDKFDSATELGEVIRTSNGFGDTTEPEEPAQAPITGEAGQPEAPEFDENQLPEKFRGKSKKTLWEAYENVEKEKGRLANEVSEARKLVDHFVRNGQPPAPKPEPRKPDPAEQAKRLERILTDPDGFEAEILQRAEQRLQQTVMRSAVDQLKRQHASVVADPGFRSWASQLRPELLQMADDDPSTFLTVINAYQTIRGQSVETPADPVQTPPAQPNQKVVTVGPAAGTNPNRKPASAHRFRRTELLDMMNNDPEKYERMQSEIMRAYASGQVLDDL